MMMAIEGTAAIRRGEVMRWSCRALFAVIVCVVLGGPAFAGAHAGAGASLNAVTPTKVLPEAAPALASGPRGGIVQVQTAPVDGTPPTNADTYAKLEELSAAVEQMRQTLQGVIDTTRGLAAQIADGGSQVSMSVNEVVGVAVGAAFGALVVDFFGGGGLATVTGAVAGGVGAHWLLTQPTE